MYDLYIYKLYCVRVGFNLKKLLKEEDLYKDRDSQIKAIEQTFESAKTPVSHKLYGPTSYWILIMLLVL